jgi:Predicted carbamoyl transferase, NodU family
MAGALLGPEFAQAEIETRLRAAGARFTVLSDAELIERTAASLAQGEAVGWMQGRMEYGPRSLGARSILADPRSPRMQKQLNLKIKYRESFRPFAPRCCATRRPSGSSSTATRPTCCSSPACGRSAAAP